MFIRTAVLFLYDRFLKVSLMDEEYVLINFNGYGRITFVIIAILQTYPAAHSAAVNSRASRDQKIDEILLSAVYLP